MDKRLIDKILPFKNEQLLRLEAFTFEQKNRPGKRQLGLLSHEAQVIEPLLTNVNGQGIISIDYNALSVALFSLVKEQQSQIDELKRDVITLKNKKGK